MFLQVLSMFSWVFLRTYMEVLFVNSTENLVCPLVPVDQLAVLLKEFAVPEIVCY